MWTYAKAGFIPRAPLERFGAPDFAHDDAVGTQAATYRLRWVATRTAAIGGQNQTVGTEAVATSDLSGEIVRLLGIGPK